MSKRSANQLCIDGVSKHFGGVVALNNVSLVARSREIVGLIGPNGAGKTTLVNVITRVTDADAGTVTLNGQDLSDLGPADVARLGIARTFQHIRLFGALTVYENVEVALSVTRRHRGFMPPFDATDLLTHVGLQDVSDREASTLAYGHQRRLEIARALALVPDFLLLDEPAAGANEVESEELNDMVKRISKESGCGTLVIDHDLQFIMNICDRLYVLDEGEIIAQGTPSEIQRDPRVVEVYIGKGAAHYRL